MKPDRRKSDRWPNVIVWLSVIFSFLLFGVLGMLSQKQRTASVVLISHTPDNATIAASTPVSSAIPSPSPSANPTTAPSPTAIAPIVSGMRGQQVDILQQALIDLGYLGGKTTGYFGSRTLEAVEEFQQRNDLPVTGEADSQTWRRLLSGDAVPSSDAPYVWATKSGKKYHSDPTCSGMQKPEQLLLSEARNSGLDPCSRCY